MPVQLWGSERGGDGVTPGSVASVDKSLPAMSIAWQRTPRISLFLTPCSPELAQVRPELCTDAPGFDRVAFHKELGAAVLAFLRKHLAEVGRP